MGDLYQTFGVSFRGILDLVDQAISLAPADQEYELPVAKDTLLTVDLRSDVEFVKEKLVLIDDMLVSYLGRKTGNYNTNSCLISARLSLQDVLSRL